MTGRAWIFLADLPSMEMRMPAMQLVAWESRLYFSGCLTKRGVINSGVNSVILLGPCKKTVINYGSWRLLDRPLEKEWCLCSHSYRVLAIPNIYYISSVQSGQKTVRKDHLYMPPSTGPKTHSRSSFPHFPSMKSWERSSCQKVFCHGLFVCRTPPSLLFSSNFGHRPPSEQRLNRSEAITSWMVFKSPKNNL